jgi:hypothetical protein
MLSCYREFTPEEQRHIAPPSFQPALGLIRE